MTTVGRSSGLGAVRALAQRLVAADALDELDDVVATECIPSVGADEARVLLVEGHHPGAWSWASGAEVPPAAADSAATGDLVVAPAEGRPGWDVAAPMVHDGQLQGVLTFHRRDGSSFDEEASELVRTFAAQCLQAVHRLRAQEASRRAHQRTVESRDLLRAITDATPDLVHVKDLEGRYTVVNDAVAALVGRPREEVIGRTPPELLGDQDYDTLSDHDRQVLESGTSAVFDEVLATEAGDRIFSASKAPLRDADGEVVGIVGISRDVTELRRLERTLIELAQREVQDQYRSVLEAMLDLITIEHVVRDESGTIVDFVIDYMNPVNIDVAGRSRDELVGRSVLEVYPAMAGSFLFDRYVQAAETGEPVVVDELPWRDEVDGEEVSGAYTVQVVPIGDTLVVCSRDISGPIEQRQLLSDAYEQLNAAQSLAHIGIWTIDPATGDVTFSDELHRIFGLADDEPVPPLEEALARLVHPDDVASTRAWLEELTRRDEPLANELRIVTTDGDTRNVVVFGATTRADDGSIARVWGTAQDVTHQRQAEEALRVAASELAREQATVSLLQRAILPTLPSEDLAELAGLYQPAGVDATIGGDWYDAFDLGDGRIGLVVGDVAGHGVPAAGLMAQIRNALRAYAFERRDPADVLSSVSGLMDQTGAPVIATCLYAVVDLADRTMTWSRAGHLPVALHRDRSVRYLEDVNGPPLGALADVRYDRAMTELEPGDLVVLYTDGLVERRGESIDDGLARLRDSIDSFRAEPLEALCRSLALDLVPTTSSDDLCVLALRVPPA